MQKRTLGKSGLEVCAIGLGCMDLAKKYNAALSKIRGRVEHGFARLKTWKVLIGLFPYHWTRLGDVVRAIAVVHNMNLEVARSEL